MELPKQESLSPLAKLKADQVRIQTQIQEARRPSRMLFQLMETTNPDSNIQHDPDLANQYDALFLTRQGNQAVIGYLTQRPSTYEEQEKWVEEEKVFRDQGITVDSAKENQLGTALNYYVKEGKEPSITVSVVDIGDDPRFKVNGNVIEEGKNLVMMQVNLDDLKNPLIQKVLNHIMRYSVAEPYLPKQLAFDPAAKRPSDIFTTEMGEEQMQEEARNLARVRYSELTEEQRAEEGMLEYFEKRYALAMRLAQPDISKIAATKELVLDGFPFSEVLKIPLLKEAFMSIQERYSETRFYFGESKNNEG